MSCIMKTGRGLSRRLRGKRHSYRLHRTTSCCTVKITRCARNFPVSKALGAYGTLRGHEATKATETSASKLRDTRRLVHCDDRHRCHPGIQDHNRRSNPAGAGHRATGDRVRNCGSPDLPIHRSPSQDHRTGPNAHHDRAVHAF